MHFALDAIELLVHRLIVLLLPVERQLRIARDDEFETSIVSVPGSTCSFSLSFGTPGRSVRSVMPVLSSNTSTGGISAMSLRGGVS